MKNFPSIFLWELAPSPHLGNLLKGLAVRDFPVRYVVFSEAYESRKGEGWIRPDFPGVDILQVRGREEIQNVIDQSLIGDIHVCVGLRGNQHVLASSAALRKAGRSFWVFMETVNERRWWSVLKRPLYRWLFLRNRRRIEAVLATGATTKAWVEARGMPKERVYEFAYFLDNVEKRVRNLECDKKSFRLLYVGNLIPRKRAHTVIEALKSLPAHVVLDIVGDGPLREQLEALAKAVAPGQVTFYGTRPMPEISGFMANADCLVLPSDHDGWGAVISEALIAGTRVVCSDRCGASVVVRASNAGQVFETFTDGACTAALSAEVARGPTDEADRAQIADWAQCLTDAAGAAYMEAIIEHVRQGALRPTAPWRDPHWRSGKPG